MAPRESKNAETFDGNLVVLPGDFNAVENSHLFLLDGSKGHLLNAKEREFVAVAADKFRAEDGIAKKLEDKSLLEECESELRELGPHLAPEFVDLVLKGRLKLLYILNTRGGDLRASDTHLDLIGSVRGRGGQTSVIGGNTVWSAGAELFMGCDRGRRYLLPESKLMFHIPFRVSMSEALILPVGKIRAEEIEHMKVILLPELVPTYRRRIARTLNKALKCKPCAEELDDCPIEFDGEEASKAGLCGLIGDLAGRFLELTGSNIYNMDKQLFMTLGNLRCEPSSLAPFGSASFQESIMEDRANKGSFWRGKAK